MKKEKQKEILREINKKNIYKTKREKLHTQIQNLLNSN